MGMSQSLESTCEIFINKRVGEEDEVMQKKRANSPQTGKQDWKIRVVDYLDVICLESHFFSREMMLSHAFAGNVTKVNQSHSLLVSSSPAAFVFKPVFGK